MGAKGCENPNGQGVADFGSVTGRVVDAKSLQPIGAFTVAIGGQSRTVSPAQKGAFSVDKVPAGTQTLTIYAIGYQTYSLPGVVVQKDQTTVVPQDIGIVSTAPQ
ncbi:carboxypeptidase-like regulatory domain-containing protein [Vulcanimicrobium alpinum]|nr:carboxypeptidase-like regulatory domain-containing protein [Vulcanimicrobium alpinum]